jgi:hypothetical protein
MVVDVEVDVELDVEVDVELDVEVVVVAHAADTPMPSRHTSAALSERRRITTRRTRAPSIPMLPPLGRVPQRP